MKTKIIVQDLAKNFGDLKVLDGVSFKVMEGEFLSILGPSGCGKTTLLFIIQGFIRQTGGAIDVDGKTGIVFQEDDLFPWKTVKGNIEIGPVSAGGSEEEINEKTKKLLKEFDLIGFSENYPHQISGGMKKRVSVARCLANDPNIVLLDEPFSSLDYLTRMKVHDFVSGVLKKKITTVLVTHDIDEALKLSDRILVLSGRPARIKGIIKPGNNTSFASAERNKKKILGMLGLTSHG